MILQDFSLEGKVALVTGADRGLGQGMALGLAEAGADMALAGVSAPEETLQKVSDLGRKGMPLICDLIKAEVADMQKMIDDVVAEFGRLDILVNNAGIIRRTPALEFSESDWDDVVQINQKAVFFLAQAAAKAMVAGGEGGKIISTASLLSFQGGINVPSYTASKSAVAGITRALANEWASKGINVNAIVPGYFATDNTAQLREDEARANSILDRIPAGRWGEPSDLAGAAVFLASKASNYVNGHLLAVDGGWLAR